MKKAILIVFAFLSFNGIHAQCWETVQVCYNHGVALRADGTIWGWGSNLSGEQGDGTYGNTYNTPMQIGADNDWKFITAGAGFCLAIKTDGTLWSWGENTYGNLGLGNTTNTYVPTQVGTDTDWKFASAGFGNAKAIKTDGTLWSWGYNRGGVLGLGLFDGNHVELSPVQTGSDTDWKTVSVGDDSALALKENGELWACGRNDVGQIGIGNISDQYVFVQVGNDNQWKNVVISINTTMSARCLATKNDGTLWTWGRTVFGGNNDYNTTPQQVGTETDWDEVGLGSTVNYLSTKTDGTLWAWGENDYATVGDGTAIDRPDPVLIDSSRTWHLPSGGLSVSAALRNDTIFTWGRSDYGQLGLGSLPSQNKPHYLSTNCNLSVAENQMHFEIYPNPATNQVYIKADESLKIDRIVIRSVSGQEVLTITGTAVAVDIENLTPGCYFIELFSNENHSSRIFMKQ